MADDALEMFTSREEFRRALTLQVEAAAEFHRLARELAGDALPVGPLPSESLAPGRNVFSTLFLAVTEALVGRSPHLALYAMVNQSMRAWVTACDNLLDDEYKPVLPFAFHASGGRMRSVLTVMLADRVLAEFVRARFAADGAAGRVGRLTLAALASSALEECEEESAGRGPLPPARVLDNVHERKTGDLFVAPLALPIELDRPDPPRAETARAALRRFGLACQILDDVMDMPDDLARGRQNLLASLAHFGGDALRRRLDDARAAPAGWTAAERFLDLVERAWSLARERFDASFDALAQIGIDLSAAERDALVRLVASLLGVDVPADAPLRRAAR